MDIDLQALRRQVESEADRYVSQYDPPEGSYGTPWSRQKVAHGVTELLSCLVEPYWIDVSIADPPHDHVGPRQTYPCIAVAEDPVGYLMVYMPHRDEFLLLSGGEGNWESLGVDGDAVGTFLAR